jgi:hypothetical protein
MNIKRLVQVTFLAAFTCFVNGCAHRLATTTSPLYSKTVTQVPSIGLTGEGASAASPAFIGQGYNVHDLGIETVSALHRAKLRSIPFVAIVDPIGTSTAWWNGCYHFSMRVMEISSGRIVWSGTARYGSGGITVNEDKSTTRAMDDMVADFGKHFPPGRGK